jgi:hypothetical protein
VPDLADHVGHREIRSMDSAKSLEQLASDMPNKSQDKHAKAALAAYRRQDGRLQAMRRARSSALPVALQDEIQDKKASSDYMDLVSEDGRVLSAKESISVPNHIKRDFTLSQASTAASTPPPEQSDSDLSRAARQHTSRLSSKKRLARTRSSVLSLEREGSSDESEIEI